MKETSVFFTLWDQLKDLLFLLGRKCVCSPVGSCGRRGFLVRMKVHSRQLSCCLSCPWLDWKSKRLGFRNPESKLRYLLRIIWCSKLAAKNSTWCTCWRRRSYNLTKLHLAKDLPMEKKDMGFLSPFPLDQEVSSLKFTCLQKTGKQCKWVKQGRWDMSV